MKKYLRRCSLAILLLFTGFIARAQQSPEFLDLNKPERLEWLQDNGFGMFIHFSFDSQLGVVISHSMVGASDDYLDRFVNELPRSFNPGQFNAREIATLARLAGMKYVVLTTKHHSGFCLWNTATTDFNIMHTPYGKDLVAEYVTALREQGLAVGFYFSPEDFHFLYRNGQVVRRSFTEPLPDSLMEEYLDFTARQVRELMTRYGQVDVLFFDGGEGPLQEIAKKTAWEINPDVLVTRGAINTPEQTVPGLALPEPWEACVTMGTQWQYKPTNDNLKSGTRLIELLIESRAKGGSLLLNIGPHPDGSMPAPQEERLREVAAWMFINREGIYDVRPWIITHEDDVWFARHKQEPTVYAFATRQHDWPRGERREVLLRSVKATGNTTVSVLGQSGEVVEYQPETDATTRFEQTADGLKVSLVRAHRIYNNHSWHNPLVIKITNAAPALDPPFVQTTEARPQGNRVVLKGELINKGDSNELKAGFYYRPYAGFIGNLYSSEWQKTEMVPLNGQEGFSTTLNNLQPGIEYEYRAVVQHPQLEVPGEIMRFTTRARDGQ